MPPVELAADLAKAVVRIPVVEGFLTQEVMPAVREIPGNDLLARLYTRVSQSVAKLEVIKGFGAELERASGSSFAYDENGRFFTAEHCIKNAKDFWLVDKAGNVHDVNLLHPTDTAKDTAVLQLRDSSSYRSFVPLSMYRQFDYARPSELYGFGHLLGNNKLTLLKGYEGALNLQTNRLTLPMGSLGGVSGGPLVRSDARPVGMVIQRISDASGTTRWTRAIDQGSLRYFAHQFDGQKISVPQYEQSWLVPDRAMARTATEKYWQRGLDQPWKEYDFHANLTRLNMPDRSVTVRGTLNLADRRMTIQPVAFNDEPIRKSSSILDLGHVTVQMDRSFNPVRVHTTNSKTASFLAKELDLPHLLPG